MSPSRPALRRWRTVIFVTVALIGACAILLWGSQLWVQQTASGRCYSSAAAVPPAPAALVLGCSPKVAGGRPNAFFSARILAAASLYHAGKVRTLIVSGDNSTPQYDEPTAMKQALIKAGVPEAAIFCDYAGFRTLDSVVRADAIFDQKRFIIVSQRFHNERAIFLARQHGLEAVGLNAADVSRSMAPMTYLREYLARVKAVLDVKLLRTTPRFYGPPVVVQDS